MLKAIKAKERGKVMSKLYEVKFASQLGMLSIRTYIEKEEEEVNLDNEEEKEALIQEAVVQLMQRSEWCNKDLRRLGFNVVTVEAAE
nr:MAG TPA: hypothetical protein [Caudoviricetes sp.]